MADTGADRPQDPHVERHRPNPSQPPQPTLTLVGFLGDSDREGMRRLYFTEELDYHAEFRTGDVVTMASVPEDQSPFPGREVTEVTLRRDAVVEYTHTRIPRPVDEFDLDVRFGSAAGQPEMALPTGVGPCRTDTCRTDCFGRTCDTCLRTCDTCRTQCNQPTCAGTCLTCQTRCNQPTCAQTCNQATCVTCRTCETQCNQPTCARTCDTCNRTCITCDTCNPHIFTCGNNPQCRF